MSPWRSPTRPALGMVCRGLQRFRRPRRNASGAGLARSWALAGALALGIALPAGSASAQLVAGGVAGQPAVPPAMPGALVLAPGDRVNVAIFGYPELSGEQVIEESGSIMLPIIGKIPAAGLTVSALEERILAYAADGFILHPQVTVRISELRPVYIIGEVRTAGAVPFRPGLTVLSALALAGGAALTPQDWLAVRGDVVESEQRLEVLLGQRSALRVRIARLTAQREGATAIDLSEQSLGSDKRSVEYVETERMLFDAERLAEERQVALLNEQIASARRQTALIGEQIRLMSQQRDRLANYLKELTQLARAGLIERRRVIDAERELGQFDTGLSRLAAESANSSQIAQEAPLRLAELRDATRRKAIAGLQEAATRMPELETMIAGLRETVDVRRQRMNHAMSPRDRDGPRYQVTRSSLAGSQTFDVSETTPLLPGDILRVGNINAATVPSASAALLGVTAAAAARPGVSEPTPASTSLGYPPAATRTAPIERRRP